MNDSINKPALNSIIKLLTGFISHYVWQAKRNLSEFFIILATDTAKCHMQGFCLWMNHCKLDDVQNISVHSGTAQIQMIFSAQGSH